MILKGGPELKARLAAMSAAGPEILARWQDTAAGQMRNTAPRRTGRGASSIHAAKLTDRRAEIRGAYWLIFVDRGTKAHVIRPKGISGSGRGGKSTSQWLVFDWHGKTVFAKKVNRRRMRRRPFITQAAQDAIRPPTMSETVIALWNRKRRGRFTKMAA